MYLSCANISQKYKECPKESLIKTKEKLHKTINSHNLKVMRIYLFVISDSYLSYFTSSKLATTDYQRLTEPLVQIRNAISILNVINQQISISIRAMLFLFFFVLFSVFLSFVGAKVQNNLHSTKVLMQIIIVVIIS